MFRSTSELHLRGVPSSEDAHGARAEALGILGEDLKEPAVAIIPFGFDALP